MCSLLPVQVMKVGCGMGTRLDGYNVVLFLFSFFFFADVFSPNYKLTIGVDFSLKTLSWDSNTKINLQLW